MTNLSDRPASYYERLKDYCESEQEITLLTAIIDNGNQTAAATALGVSSATVLRYLNKIRTRTQIPAKIVGEFNTAIKSPFLIKGTSTLYDAQTGEAKISWVKTDVNKNQQLEDMLDAVKDSVANYKPFKAVKAPKGCDKDKLVILPMGDPHIGMYAWAAESGEDYDIEIAEKNLRKAVAYLIEKAPPAETCIILNLGDFFHSDNSNNTTTRGTNVDVDGRYAKVLQVGVTLMIDCVNLALAKFNKVIVKNNIGNHDSHTSQVLSICMEHAFKNNKRVEIAEPANPFFIYEFGNCMLFSTHGDKVKPKTCQGMVANYFPELWGRTEHRYAMFGHFHHEFKEESNGLLIEIFNTLASSDAWHSASGYRSKRNMKCIVLDREDGEIERYTFGLKRQSLVN